ncbi:MAG TPA: hypothetical protein VIM55_07850 [Mucilaginibacter sp.]
MKERYGDMKIDSNSYFLMSFGLSRSATSIHDKNYWKLNCQEGSYFFLSGYLRKQGDVIWYIPSAFASLDMPVKENKLFDFGAKVNDSWAVFNQKIRDELLGDSIKVMSIRRGSRDTIFEYQIAYFQYNTSLKKIIGVGHHFNLEVNPRLGIVSITSIGVPSKFYYKAILQPKEKFINTMKGTVEL